MQPKSCFVPSLLLLLVGFSQARASEPDLADTKGSLEAYSVVERGKDHTLLRQITSLTNEQSGVAVQVTNQFTLLENCLNYLEDGVWKESEDLIESFPHGAIATRGPNKAIFSHELNTEIVFDIQASDGKRLAGGVRGIQLTDVSTGKSVVVGSLRESVTGRIIPPNQILYEDAFSGIKADVLLVWKHNLFGHEVVLREQPQLPQGWEPANTRLEVLTEFYTSHEPELRKSKVTREGEPPIEDDSVIHFGALAMVTGKALPVEGDGGFAFGGITSEGVSVIKQWHSTEDDRRFLIESVSWQEVREGLSRLPVAQQANNSVQPKNLERYARNWPARPPLSPSQEPMLVADLGYHPKGFLVDFTIIPDQGTPGYLTAGTYYIKTSYYSGSSVTFSPGCVIKFKENAWMILYGPILFPASGTRPVFTSRNDDTFGEVIQGVSGEPNSDGNPSSHRAAQSIWIYYSTYTSEIRNAHIRWSKIGIQRDRNSGSSAWLTVNNCFFQNITGTGSAGFVGDPTYVTATNLKKCNVTTQGLTMTQDCIGIENSFPGDPSWVLTPGQEATTASTTIFWPTSPSDSTPQIEGFATETSQNIGGNISFYVDVRNGSPYYKIEFYRMGWYAGDGGRKMSWVNSATGVSVTHITRTAVKQPIPTTHPTTGLIDCLLPGNTWTDPYTLTIPVGWVSGVYLAKLTTSITPSQPTTWQSYIIFVVREDGRNSDLYFQSSVTTFQAYNPWGGKSLYPHPGGIANKVSFNRPYAASSRSDLRYGTGAGEFFVMINASPLPAWEYNALRWMEKQSYDLTYCTDIDTHNTSGAGCLLNKSIKAFLSVGHDEYWSQAMRDNVKAARDRTTNPINLVFMGANACHFRIGLESSGSTPLRTMVCNKVNSADLWRNTEHEVSLIGVEFVRNSFDKPLTVVNPSGGHWAFDHTGINPGSSSTLPGLLGYEVDGEWIGVNPCFDFNTVGPNFGSGPYDTIKLADSIFQTCTQGYQTPTPVGGANGHGYMTVYTAALGPISDPHAQVFATGSMQWCWGLDAFGYPTKFSPPALVGSRVSSISQQITHNILQTFSGKTRYMLPP